MEQCSPHFQVSGREDQVNNNNAASSSSALSNTTDDYPKNGRVSGWTEERHDSGHFTVSPDVEQGGCNSDSSSPRGPSPSHHNNHQSTNSATLVLQACRERKSSQPRKIDVTDATTKYAYSSHDNNIYSSSTESCKYGGGDRGSSRRRDSVSVADSDEVSSLISSPSVSYLKTALDNFNALYQEKLQMIDDVGAQGDTAMKQSLVEKKAQILECWAKDVCVQNIVLIHTVEELEKQGEEKMRTLQQKISESSNLAKRHKEVVKSYEERIQTLLTERASSHETHLSLKHDLDKIKTEYKRIRGRVNQLEKDNDSLVTLITRIRDMGVWDVEGLEFHRRTFAQMFELYPHLPGSEVQTVFTREKLRHIRETEDTVEKLESKVSDLEAFQSKACHVIDTKDSTISELKKEMACIAQKLQGCQEECDHYKKSLIETHEKLLETTNELQNFRTKNPSRPHTVSEEESDERHLEIQELLQELRNVKDRLNVSVQESQSAKEETNIIRKEFSDRLREVCLQSELTHSFDTHHLVQDKQMELEKVKQEVQTYQLKCETTEVELNHKDKIIEELQNTIKQLNNKKNVHDSHEVEVSRDLLATKTLLTPTSSSHLKCHRDRSTKKPPALPRHATQQRTNGQKPAWSDNFLKTSALDNCSSATTIASSSKSTLTLGSKKMHANCNRSSCDKLNRNNSLLFSNHDMYKTNQLGNQLGMSEQKYTGNCCKSKISLCSCALLLDRGENSNSPCHTNCSNSANYSFEINSIPVKKNDRKTSEMTEENIIKIGLSHQKDNQKNDCGAAGEPKMDNPRINSSAYDILMGVAVKASQNILDSKVPKNISSITVTAGHRSFHKNKGKDSKSQATTKVACNNSNNNPTNPIPEPCANNEEQQSTQPAHVSKSLEELLSELPEQPYAKVVREWIKSSSSSSSDNNTKTGKKYTGTENPILRKIISQPVIADKALSLLASEKKSLISSSKVYAEKTNQIEKDIIGIQEEWSRVFCDDVDLPYPTTGANDHSFESATNHYSVCQERTTPTTQEKESTSTLSSEAAAAVVTSTGTIDRQKLIQQFEMEKSKLAENFSKQLKDKNIEIKMQKDCLRNYDDNAVSLWELVNAFDNFKLDATKKLEDLRRVNNNLTCELHGMNDKLVTFNQLVQKKMKGSKWEDRCQPASATATASSSYEKHILAHFSQQIQQFMVEVKDSCTKIESLEGILHKMESFGPDTIDEIHKMEWELQIVEGINGQLQSKLEMSNKEIQRLSEDSDYLRREKEDAEVEMLSTRVEVHRLKELVSATTTTNNNNNESPCNATIYMEQMKQAFLKNEEIIQSQNEEIVKKDALIKQYQKYCKKAQAYVQEKSYGARQVEREQWISEKAKMLSEKKELQNTVAKLENKLIRSETDGHSLRESLHWYMNQVQRVQNLHTTWLRNLPGFAMSDPNPEQVWKARNGATDAGSGDK